MPVPMGLAAQALCVAGLGELCTEGAKLLPWLGCCLALPVNTMHRVDVKPLCSLEIDVLAWPCTQQLPGNTM